ncbi:hypothetical protein Nepgr_000603 [Nepenthes gracilis]|uniref:Uncharacterized protein n=1 Tax=Nepenthes gracilis TaxID=150966 RepID=A0AAD3P6Q4_NEPGR|nr:hypothetical protein Nepgr_000603 [Nepenthes gracilis]
MFYEKSTQKRFHHLPRLRLEDTVYGIAQIINASSSSFLTAHYKIERESSFSSSLPTQRERKRGREGEESVDLIACGCFDLLFQCNRFSD